MGGLVLGGLRQVPAQSHVLGAPRRRGNRPDGRAGCASARAAAAERARPAAVGRANRPSAVHAGGGRRVPGVAVAGGRPRLAAEVSLRTRGNPYFVQTLAAVAAGEPCRAPRRETPARAGGPAGRQGGRSARRRASHRAGRRLPALAVPDRVLRRVAGLSDPTTDVGRAGRHGRGSADRRTAVATPSRTTCCGRPCTTTCCPARKRGCMPPTARPSSPGTPAPRLRAEVAHHYTEAHDAPKSLSWSVKAAEEAMRCARAGRGARPPGAGVTLAGVGGGRRTRPTLRRGARSAGSRWAGGAGGFAAGLAGETSRAIEWARRAIRLCDADGDAPGGGGARGAGTPAGRGRRDRPGGAAGGGGRAPR